MRKKATALTLAVSTLALPLVALAAAPRTYTELAQRLVSILDSGVGLLVAAGLAVYFWNIAKNMTKANSGGIKDLQPMLTWGILALFVMVSIWGILQLLQNSLFGGSSGLIAPALHLALL